MLSPLTRDALAVWYRKMEAYSLSTEQSPLTPLFDNPALPEGRLAHSLEGYTRDPWPTAQQFVDAAICTFVTYHGTASSRVTWLTHIHLTSYCKKLHESKLIHRHLTGFEQLCTSTDTPRHALSLIYKLILDHTYDSLPKYTTAWLEELGRDITEAEWAKAFLFTHKSSISSYTQEKNYKLLSRWYWVPTTLRNMFPSATDICWRCSSATGMFRHIW